MEQNQNSTGMNNPEANQDNQSDINGQSIEEQEQMNSADLVQQIEENSQTIIDSEGNEITDPTTRSEEDLSGFLQRTIPDSANNNPPENERPLNKNLLGDNPPGAEQTAFESKNIGDAGAEQFTYESENLVEGFRENLDKTEQQLNLDKKLKDQMDKDE